MANVTASWRGSKDASTGGWAPAIILSLLIHLALWPLSQPATLFGDFYKAYWLAGVHLWRGGLDAAYPFLEFKGDWSNLPILARPFALLVPFGREAAGWIYLGAGYVAVAAAWLLLARLGGLSRAPRAALLCLFLLNGPLLNSLREGNSTHFVLMLLALGLTLWQGRRDYAAGLALGLCAAIKPALVLLGVYFLLRGRLAIVAGGATAIAVAVLASIADFGLAANLEWFRDTIAYNAGRAMPAYNAQTVDGFLLRLSTGAGGLFDWGSVEPGAAQKAVRYALLAAAAGGLGWAMLAASRRGDISPSGAPGPHDFLQVSAVLLIALTLSSISWTHYYLYLLIPAALHLGGKLPLPEDGATRLTFWGGYGLASLPALMPDPAALAPGAPPSLAMEIFARTAVSAWLLGGLLLLGCFGRAAWLALRREAGARPEMAFSRAPEPQSAL